MDFENIQGDLDPKDAYDRLEKCGFPRRDITIKKTTTYEYGSDGWVSNSYDRWNIRAWSDKETIHHERTVDETAPTLEQAVARVELKMGVKKPGDDLVASQGETA